MDGVVGPRRCKKFCEKNDLESSAEDGDSPVFEARCRDHPVRLNTPERPIVDQYREGKVKSTSNRRVK